MDGPVHDFPDRAKRDAEVRGRLDRTGFCVVRAGADDSWPTVVADYAFVFGEGRER